MIRAHINRDGLDRTEAAILHKIFTGAAPRDPSNPETVAIGALLNAGLIEPGVQAHGAVEAPLVLSGAVRFGLLLHSA